MNIIFMGTPDFAVPALMKLIEDSHNILLVVTQPDKPKGRRQILTPPPVKELAIENSLEVYQPQSFKTPEVYERLSALKPDIIIVAAYGKILPKAILDLPEYGCVNLHASILPKYRGTAPIQWAIMNGEKETGITTMQMDVGIDTGGILLCEKTAIGENETSGELFERLAAMCPGILARTLEKIEDMTIEPLKQDESGATYAPLLGRELSLIDWNLPARVIHNKIRGLSPWPLALTEIGGRRVKLFSSLMTDMAGPGDGKVFFEGVDGLYALCGDGKVLFLRELQAEGGKRMPSADFLRGNKL